MEDIWHDQKISINWHATENFFPNNSKNNVKSKNEADSNPKEDQRHL